MADLIEYNTFVDSTEIDFTDNNHQITAAIGKISGTKIIYREADPNADPAVTEQTINQKAAELEGAIDSLADYVGEIPATSSATDVIGYVDEKTGEGVDALNGSADIASVTAGVVTLKAGVVEEAGIIDNSTAADIVLAKLATTGAAEDVAITDSGSYFTATDVEAAFQEVGERMTWVEV